MGKIGPAQPSLENLQATSEKRSKNVALKGNESGPEGDRLKQAAQDFEAIFLQIMLDSMRKTIPKSELFKQSGGEEVFRSMLDQEYANVMAGQGISGISDAIEKQMAQVLQSRGAKASGLAEPTGQKRSGVDVDHLSAAKAYQRAAELALPLTP